MQRPRQCVQTHHIHKIIPQTPIDEDGKSRYNKQQSRWLRVPTE